MSVITDCIESYKHIAIRSRTLVLSMMGDQDVLSQE
jgi:hypothetical protein